MIMTEARASLTPTVEDYARRYPDVPMEVILKEDLLRPVSYTHLTLPTIYSV